MEAAFNTLRSNRCCLTGNLKFSLATSVIEGWCLVGFWCLIVSISAVRTAAVESLSWWVFVGVWFSMFVLEMSWRRSRICGGFCTIGTVKL